MCLILRAEHPDLLSTSPHAHPQLRVLPCALGLFPSRLGVLEASRGELTFRGALGPVPLSTAQYLGRVSFSLTLFQHPKLSSGQVPFGDFISEARCYFLLSAYPYLPQSMVSSCLFWALHPCLLHPFTKLH